jgi:hypothetical protein
MAEQNKNDYSDLLAATKDLISSYDRFRNIFNELYISEENSELARSVFRITLCELKNIDQSLRMIEPATGFLKNTNNEKNPLEWKKDLRNMVARKTYERLCRKQCKIIGIHELNCSCYANEAETDSDNDNETEKGDNASENTSSDEI